MSALAPCTLWTVASLAGRTMPEIGRRGHCPFRKHRRADKTLSVFESRSGDVLYKCHSCDPPYNMGDAVQLYAGLYHLDRKAAWHELRDRGYAVPGSDERYAPDKPAPPRRPPPKIEEPPRVRVEGEHLAAVLPFDQDKFRHWQEKDTGARRRFAAMRALSFETLAAHDVVDVSDDIIGFGYRQPDTRAVCRVKMRPLDKKTYWIEPKPPKDQARSGKALGPLYLAHELPPPAPGLKSYAVITEGEVDALTLKHLGVARVVSLPDGARSAATVDLKPISFGYALWFLATDDDQDGAAAYAVLRKRARHLGVMVARVCWNAAGQAFKDANAALMGGMTADSFAANLQEAARAFVGWRVQL